MPSLRIFRTEQGRWRVEANGCCDARAYRREYERAFLVQTLREGGSLDGWDATRVTVRDRRGRLHTITA